MNENTIHNINGIHVGRNVRTGGLAAKQHSSIVCAGKAGMSGSVRFRTSKSHTGKMQKQHFSLIDNIRTTNLQAFYSMGDYDNVKMG